MTPSHSPGGSQSAMKIGISAKLFVAVFVACAIVLSVQALVIRRSFERGFFDYLDEQNNQRMEEVLPRMRAAYRVHGNWDFLRADPGAWFQLVLPHREGEDVAPRLSTADQTGAIARMGLLDTDHRRVIGNVNVDRGSRLRAIVVEGRTVGWVAMVPFGKAVEPGRDHFMQQQRHALLLIVVVSLIVVGLLTFFFTRGILSRVRSLTAGTRALSSGDFSARIEAGRQDELGRLAQDFNRMAQALEHNERSRRGFMADISHELRTPLAVVRAEIEAIQDGIRPVTPQSLDVIHQEIGRLDKLIDDLHDLSLTDVGAMAYRHEPVDLGIVLRSALASMEGRFRSAGLRLRTQLPDGPMSLLGDESRLQQLFCNLLENALRYTDAGGEVVVRAASDDAVTTLVFEDSAPGVPADKLTHLFDRFYRVEASRNRASGGSGLGLAICRNIVEAHGGRIASSPSPLGGLRIVVELPVTAP